MPEPNSTEKTLVHAGRWRIRSGRRAEMTVAMAMALGFMALVAAMDCASVFAGTVTLVAGVGFGFLVFAIQKRRVALADFTEAMEGISILQSAMEAHGIYSEADSRGRITRANNEFCRISGYSWEELLGQDHRLLNSGTHPRSFWKEMYAALARDGKWNGVVRNRAKDGSYYWVQTTIVAVKNAKGKIERYISMRMDVTAQKRSEQLQEGLRRVLELLAGGTDIKGVLEELVALVQTQSSTMRAGLLTIDEAKRLRLAAAPGLPEAYVHAVNGLQIGPDAEPFSSVVSSGMREIIVNISVSAESSPSSQAVLAANLNTAWIEPICSAQGEVLGLLAMYFGHPRELSGDLESVASAAAQMAAVAIERDRTVAKLLRTEEFHRLALVAERTNNSVIISDVHRRIVWVNNGFTRITGYSPEEAVGKTPVELIYFEKTDRAIAAEHQSELEAGQPAHAQLLYRGKTGREFWLDVDVQPIRDDQGALSGFVAVQTDITAIKEMQAQLEEARSRAESASLAKGQFLAHMSHEIRTPINGVSGMLDLLITTNLTSQQRNFASMGRTAVDNLLDVINDILDFSKIEAGKLDIECAEFDLVETTERVVQMLAHQAQEKGLEITCVIGSDVPRRVIGDATRVRQILLNLLGNAIKFTSQGSVTVRVVTYGPRDDQANLRFSVSDTGVGISPDRVEKLFKPFSQADSSTTRRFGGTGLGLAICKRLAEGMGGSIGVESDADRGSTFWFTARAGVGAANLPDRDGDVFAIVAPLPRVLVVGSSESERAALCHQLQHIGLKSAPADGMARALAMIAEAASTGQPFGVAIVDSDLPGDEARHLAKAVHSNPAFSSTVVILQHPASVVRDDHRLSEDGFAAALVKPAMRSVLFDTIRTAIGLVVDKPVTDADAIPSPPPRDRAIKILIVEDNAINQLVVRSMLSRAGFDCTVVEDGRKAVDAVKTGSYDLVLMDCQLPEMDGFEATRAIRELELVSLKESPRIRPRLPIIALTANAMQEDRHRCLAAGMDDYASKPINLNELLQQINRLLAMDVAAASAA